MLEITRIDDVIEVVKPVESIRYERNKPSKLRKRCQGSEASEDIGNVGPWNW